MLDLYHCLILVLFLQLLIFKKRASFGIAIDPLIRRAVWLAVAALKQLCAKASYFSYAKTHFPTESTNDFYILLKNYFFLFMNWLLLETTPTSSTAGIPYDKEQLVPGIEICLVLLSSADGRFVWKNRKKDLSNLTIIIERTLFSIY